MRVAAQRSGHWAIVLVLCCLLPSLSRFAAQQKTEVLPAEPKLLSLFPLGGRQGTTFDLEIRGQVLNGSYGVWFDSPDLKATVKNVQEIDLAEIKSVDEKPKPKQSGHKVSLTVELSASAKPGAHPLRLLSRGGISNALSLQVNSEPVIAESETPHNKPGETQPIAFPIVVNGRLNQKGEI